MVTAAGDENEEGKEESAGYQDEGNEGEGCSCSGGY